MRFLFTLDAVCALDCIEFRQKNGSPPSPPKLSVCICIFVRRSCLRSQTNRCCFNSNTSTVSYLLEKYLKNTFFQKKIPENSARPEAEIRIFLKILNGSNKRSYVFRNFLKWPTSLYPSDVC